VVAHSPHAPVSLRHPVPWRICDRCGFRYLYPKTSWQYEWRGNDLVNIGLIVCPRCLDVPQENLKVIIIGPDPVPVKDPRPGTYTPPSLEVIEDCGSQEPLETAPYVPRRR
jgi:hypothetical protein